MPPSLSHSRKVSLTIAALVALPLGLMAYKVRALGYSLADVLPVTQYEVTYALQFDGHGGDVRIRSFLPANDAHQTISEERDSSSGLHLTQQIQGANRVATWAGAEVPDRAQIRHTFKVLSHRMEYEIPSDLASGLTPRAFRGTTDALSALRLGEASCNGKSRLFVALARATGIPARLVGDLILTSGPKKTSHQWVEAYVAGHWVPFCPTNHHFAELPQHYLTLYYGDETLFKHSAEINFDYRFESRAALVA